MLVIDDVILLPFSFGDDQIMPNYLALVFKVLHKLTLEEMYPLDKIQNAIKENRMLYEFNENTKENYEKENKRLIKQLKMAKKVKELSFGVKMTTLN
ncbi:MAG: protein gvpG [Nanoarchaeota archaeon]|nr:protein gvpG [Nanoarchaeota archaeon]MCG2717498.1 protein gvpG [Nanoarchaeota archaeon]